MARSSLFSELLASIAERGRTFADFGKTRARGCSAAEIIDLCHALLTGKGEATGIALALEILTRYAGLPDGEKTLFFEALGADFSASQHDALNAAQVYLNNPTPENLIGLSAAVEPKRLELLRRLNQAPDATLSLVKMRADLLKRIAIAPALKPIDHDFVSVFGSWFNRGFLELRRIDWQTPASILEKIIKHEAVHSLDGWDDLRSRIDPPDRHLYGFFHPRLNDEPLIFVEIALSDRIVDSIEAILSDRREHTDPSAATVAIFYSISNCQDGLKGIPLGSFLIKQVVEDLRHRFAGLRTFATLSPLPSFRNWLNRQIELQDEMEDTGLRRVLAQMDHENWWLDEALSRRTERQLLPLAAHFLCNTRDPVGRIIDPVARFHLGNGARLERLNWNADTGAEGLRNSCGIMVNYLYDLEEIERNHEQFATTGLVNAAQNVKRLTRTVSDTISEPTHNEDNTRQTEWPRAGQVLQL